MIGCCCFLQEGCPREQARAREVKMSTKVVKLGSSFVLLIATTLLQHAGATSSSTSAMCTDEVSACTNDSGCGECHTGYHDYMDEWQECTVYFEGDGDRQCGNYAAIACCMDLYSATDCMGNSAFLGFYTCMANDWSTRYGGAGECSMTCNYGSAGGVVDDDATRTDTTTETEDDAVGNDDATEDDDGAVGSDDTTATDDDATVTDDGGVGNYNGTATDDGAVANEDDTSDSSANTGGTSGAGSSSPSAMLTYALGLAFLSAAPVFDVLL